MMVARIVGCDEWLASCFFFPFLFFFVSNMWICFDLVVVWVVDGMVVGWVLPIWWWMLGFTGM